MKTFFWILLPVSFLGTIATHIFGPETPGFMITALLLLLASIIGLLVVYWGHFRKSTIAYSTNSFIVGLLVFSLIAVVNYMASQHLGKFDLDLTKNKVHTLSDQTEKLIRGLKAPLKATLYGNPGEREKLRVLIDKLKGLNTQFQTDFIDFNRDITRVKQAGIRKSNTLVLNYNGKDQKFEDPTEEKIANALTKLFQEKTKTLCVITGHGEKTLSSNEAEGLLAVSKGLKDQGYENHDVNLFEQSKIPETCDGIWIAGPMKPYFEKEAAMVRDYLDGGGRAMVMLDIQLKGSDPNPELNAVLLKWHIKPLDALVVDPIMQRLGGDAATIQVQNYSKSHSITKDFQIPTAFPLVRPFEVVSGAPAGLHVEWIAQSLPTAWGETDIKGISKGAVSNNKEVDKPGPLSVAVAVDGKQPGTKATRNTRIVAFGNSGFATNAASRFGGNLDFVLNSVSWLMEDENAISVRAREEEPGKLELDAKQGTLIFWLTVVLLPLAVVILGIIIWFRRRGM